MYSIYGQDHNQTLNLDNLPNYIERTHMIGWFQSF